jgi:hypothetical protein
MAYVNKNTEYYLIHSMGLTKKQIKDMLLSEVDEYCNKIIRKELDNQKMFIPKKKEKS